MHSFTNRCLIRIIPNPFCGTHCSLADRYAIIVYFTKKWKSGCFETIEYLNILWFNFISVGTFLWLFLQYQIYFKVLFLHSHIYQRLFHLIPSDGMHIKAFLETFYFCYSYYEVRYVPRKGFGSAESDTIYTIYYLSLCTQSAESNQVF